LKETFLLNGYPENILNSILFGFRNCPNDSNVSLSDHIGDAEVEKVGCLVLPYVAEIHRQLVTLCKREGVHLLYSRQANLGNLIAPNRPLVPTEKTRSCVYEIPCKNCDAVYIGETKRSLATRCSEHFLSCRKAFSIQKVPTSEIHDTGLPHHAFNLKHEFDFQNAKVLRTEPHSTKRKILESIEIEKSSNSVNLNKGKRLDMSWIPIIHNTNYFETRDVG
jgi:GIY-YIG catalytic domain